MKRLCYKCFSELPERARILLRLMEGGTRLFLRMLYPKTPDIYRRQ